MDPLSSVPRLAVLIDGDNASGSFLPLYLEAAGRYGKVTTKRVYGDWTSPHMKKWKESLNKTAFRPIQKFEYTKSKNSTDTMLIIDAMDLLHLSPVEGFCIVSSDSDYTGLAHRLREHGKFVMGIGQAFTPEAFINACEVFILIENLISKNTIESVDSTFDGNGSVDTGGGGGTSADAPSQVAYSVLQEQHNRNAISPTRKVKTYVSKEEADIAADNVDWKLVEEVFEMTEDCRTGEADLHNLANNFRKVDPSFTHRSFGYATFRKFCESLAPRFLVVETTSKRALSLCKISSARPAKKSRVI